MKHFLRRFLWMTISCSALLVAANATQLTISNVVADDQGYVFISTDDTVLGNLVGLSNCCVTPAPVQVTLNPTQTYYIHVEAINGPGAGGFLSDFSLDNASMIFKNGTQSLDTSPANAQYWNAAYGGTTGGSFTPQPWVTPGSSEQALSETAAFFGPNTIWAPDSNSSPGGNAWNDQCLNCYVTFSTTISPSPEPSTMTLLGSCVLSLFGLGRLRRRRS